MTEPELVRCEGCGEPVGVAYLQHHPDDGAAVLCKPCAEAWEAEPW